MATGSDVIVNDINGEGGSTGASPSSPKGSAAATKRARWT